MRAMRIFLLLSVWMALSSGCVRLSGLKPTAAADMSCKEEELSTDVIREGYAPDDFGARVVVTGCGNRAEYEKKGPDEWMLVSEVEPEGRDEEKTEEKSE
jgi:hypothetical protein